MSLSRLLRVRDLLLEVACEYNASHEVSRLDVVGIFEGSVLVYLWRKADEVSRLDVVGIFEGSVLVYLWRKADKVSFMVSPDGSWSLSSDLSSDFEVLYGQAWALWRLRVGDEFLE